MNINDRKFTEALRIVQDSIGNLRAVAELAGVSEMYVRKLFKQNETFMAVNTVDIFGRTFYELDGVRDAVDERNKAIDVRNDARAALSEAKEEKRVTHANTPTLLDLRIEARELGIPVSNKTKVVLAVEIEIRKEAIASGEAITPSDDPYLLKTNDELRVLCRKYGLKTAGTKPFIIARLKEFEDAEVKAKSLAAEVAPEVTLKLEDLGGDAAVEALEDYVREGDKVLASIGDNVVVPDEDAKSAASLLGLVAE